MKHYVVGFILSLVLTMAAYWLVASHLSGATVTITIILVLAVVQFLVQMIFFLHLGRGNDAAPKAAVVAFTVGVVVIIVGGSIWIMNNLNYRMTPGQVNHYLHRQDDM